jgi:hypothetical protein
VLNSLELTLRIQKDELYCPCCKRWVAKGVPGVNDEIHGKSPGESSSVEVSFVLASSNLTADACSRIKPSDH